MKGIFIPADSLGSIKVVDYSEPLYMSLAEAVGGFFEIVNIHSKVVKKPRMIINDCGAINGMQFNFCASMLYGGHIYGPAIIMKEEYTEDGPDIVGLTDEEIKAMGLE